jgi:hypothetical protein
MEYGEIINQIFKGGAESMSLLYCYFD